MEVAGLVGRYIHTHTHACMVARNRLYFRARVYIKHTHKQTVNPYIHTRTLKARACAQTPTPLSRNFWVCLHTHTYTGKYLGQILPIPRGAHDPTHSYRTKPPGTQVPPKRTGEGGRRRYASAAGESASRTRAIRRRRLPSPPPAVPDARLSHSAPLQPLPSDPTGGHPSGRATTVFSVS